MNVYGILKKMTIQDKKNPSNITPRHSEDQWFLLSVQYLIVSAKLRFVSDLSLFLSAP